MRIIIAESERFPELAKLYTHTVIKQGRQLLCRYFDAHPQLNFVDSEAMAHIFIGSLVSYVLAQEILYGKEIIPLEYDRLIDSLVNLVINQKHLYVSNLGCVKSFERVEANLLSVHKP